MIVLISAAGAALLDAQEEHAAAEGLAAVGRHERT